MSTKPRKIPFDWYVCPVTKEKLIRRGDSAFSAALEYRYDRRGNFWNFLPRSVKKNHAKKWDTWLKLQENAAVSYKNDPRHNLGIGRRKDHEEFAKFCDCRGVVLDVGCGPQKMPTHIRYYNVKRGGVFFIGLDPFPGENPKDFPYVQAIGEYIPFREQLFDQVIFATSFDHLIDPTLALKEAVRVLKESGEICVWFGEKSGIVPQMAESPGWYRSLSVPGGAADPFHFERLTDAKFSKYIKAAGLCPKEKHKEPVNEWRASYFYRLKTR